MGRDQVTLLATPLVRQANVAGSDFKEIVTFSGRAVALEAHEINHLLERNNVC
jgi:hypothetical protein